MRINYSRVMRQAEQIDDLGGDLKRIGDQLYSMMDEIPQAWSGEAARAYLRICEELRLKLQKTSQRINTVSNNIRTAAQRIHDEDERMAASASQKLKS